MNIRKSKFAKEMIFLIQIIIHYQIKQRKIFMIFSPTPLGQTTLKELELNRNTHQVLKKKELIL